MSNARAQAMADIQTQLNQQKTFGDVTKATQFYPSNNPNLPGNIQNQYDPIIAPPPPPGSGEPEIPGQENLVADSEKNINFARYYQAFANRYNRFVRGLRANSYRMNRRLGNIPTPGGVWVPIGLLLFFFLILIPVNGHTRIRWLWNVFVGSSSLLHNESIAGITKQPVTPQTSTFTGFNNQNTQTQQGPTQSILPQPEPTPIYNLLGNSGNYLLIANMGDLS